MATIPLAQPPPAPPEAALPTTRLSDPLQEARRLTGLCTLCGSCIPVCPVYRETLFEAFGPRGRIALVRAVAEGQLPFLEAEEALDSCLGCRACEPPCPAGVEWGHILEHYRAATEPKKPRSLLRRWAMRTGLGQVLGSPGGLKLAAAALWFYQQSGLRRLAHSSGLVTRLAGAAADLDAVMPPVMPPWRRRQAPATKGSARSASATPGPRVAFFTGCIQDMAFAHVNDAAMRVLAAAGCQVLSVPGQGCCGAVHAHAGEHDLAVAQARRNLRAFAAVQADYVVLVSGGCGAALKDYPYWFPDDKEPALAAMARAFAAKVRDFSELMAELPLPALGPVTGTVTYQDSCHLRNVQKVAEPPRQLLQAVPGLRYVELPEADHCCGAGGIYNITQPEMSRRILDRKMAHVRETGATILAVANAPCQLQLLMGARRSGLDQEGLQVRHVAEILHDALQNRT